VTDYMVDKKHLIKAHSLGPKGEVEVDLKVARRCCVWNGKDTDSTYGGIVDTDEVILWG